jgi:hypothetical protein
MQPQQYGGRGARRRSPVTGLFDLMTFHFGDPLADLPRQFAMYQVEPAGRGTGPARGFVTAYLSAAGLTLDQAAVRKALLYLVAERLPTSIGRDTTAGRGSPVPT